MKCAILVLTASLAACRGPDPTGLAAPPPCENGFFRAVTDSPEALAELASDPSVVRSRLVEPDPDVLRHKELLTLNLFEDSCLHAVRERLETNGPTSLVWLGRLRDSSDGHVVLAREGSAVVGSITLPGKSYQLRVLSSGVHAVVELDLDSLPPEAEPLVPPSTTSAPR